MAFPVMVLNNSTGSNTGASGAPSSLSPITGIAAAHTNGAASTTITLTNSPDLSDVPTDGGAAIYLATSSGRKFSMITAVDNAADSVTVEDSFTIVSGSAVDYAIGGKRKDFENINEHTKDFGNDSKPGWELNIEETGTDYVLTSTFTQAVSGSEAVGWIRIGSRSATKPIITSNTDSVDIFTISGTRQRIVFENLEITHGSSGANKGHGITSGSSSVSTCMVNRCHIHDCDAGVQGTSSSANSWTVSNCTIENNVSHGWGLGAASSFNYCRIINNGGAGVQFGSGGGGISARNCLFAGNTLAGLATGTSSHTRTCQFIGSTFADNGGDGLDVTMDSASFILLQGNLFYGNGGFGFDNSSSVLRPEDIHVNLNNAYGGNTSGDHDNWVDGEGFIEVTADPFVDSANDDWRLNQDSGGGALLIGAGFGGTDIGAMGHEEPAGGGGFTPLVGAGGLAG